MAKNFIPEIAKMLGVELGEEFKIKGDDELTYRFDSAGLKITHYSGIEIAEIAANIALVNLVNGKDKIVKLPWKPKEGEDYYTFIYDCYHKWCVWQQRWSNHPFDLALLEKGWIYRSQAEAEAPEEFKAVYYIDYVKEVQKYE